MTPSRRRTLARSARVYAGGLVAAALDSIEPQPDHDGEDEAVFRSALREIATRLKRGERP